jgi:hypothetical protein
MENKKYRFQITDEKNFDVSFSILEDQTLDVEFDENVMNRNIKDILNNRENILNIILNNQDKQIYEKIQVLLMNYFFYVEKTI